MTKGNIILIHSKWDPIGALIQLFTRSYWHHVGIFTDNGHILEARGRSIVISPARKYIYNKLYDYKIVKIKGLTPNDIKKAVNYMVAVSEKGYLKWIKACFMAFFDSKKEFPRRTCSGLIADGFSKVGFYFKKDKTPDRVTPGDIAKSSKVKNVTGRELFRKII